jgi:hypothetical protein
MLDLSKMLSTFVDLFETIEDVTLCFNKNSPIQQNIFFLFEHTVRESKLVCLYPASFQTSLLYSRKVGSCIKASHCEGRVLTLFAANSLT